MTIPESEMTERLDERNLLGVAHEPGVYALRVDVPKTPSVAIRHWREEYHVTPGENALEQLAAAGLVLYVGAGDPVYDRLTDHFGGGDRQAALLSVFDPVDVFHIWPYDSPFDREYGVAQRLASREGFAVWVDGEVIA